MAMAKYGGIGGFPGQRQGDDAPPGTAAGDGPTGDSGRPPSLRQERMAEVDPNRTGRFVFSGTRVLVGLAVRTHVPMTHDASSESEATEAAVAAASAPAEALRAARARPLCAADQSRAARRRWPRPTGELGLAKVGAAGQSKGGTGLEGFRLPEEQSGQSPGLWGQILRSRPSRIPSPAQVALSRASLPSPCPGLSAGAPSLLPAEESMSQSAGTDAQVTKTV
ncbi:uncharacterized protein LOC115292522 [Suricata suricatta]|uniref:uncharacterized protein LOC115292522 n=1 Tax=Suricata suricatta TaxID=37032 RepID=UPI001155C71B|nr:uncharacterized protein LOC115292522 [Suricata suricatta]